VKLHPWISAAAVAFPLIGVHAAFVWAGSEPSPAREAPALGSLRAPDADTARAQALQWLKSAGKVDGASLKQFDAIWSASGPSILDRVASTLALGDAEAAKLLAEVRDVARAAPMTQPGVLKDAKRPAYYRANLGLAYAKALSNRRIYEETLATLRAVRPDQVVDPAAYFFHRAVAEHALSLKRDAMRSLTGLLEDVADAPDRYKLLGLLMYQDMQGWRDKDLGDIARKMDNIERRLELARGGPHTQKMQKEVVARLDELIKQLEKASDSNGGSCPNGGSSGGARPNNPMNDSRIAKNSGPGNVDQKRLSGLAQQWGRLPEKERAKAMQDLIREMPPRHREVIESYFKKLAQSQANQP
jgi:hypothetical protein